MNLAIFTATRWEFDAVRRALPLDRGGRVTRVHHARVIEASRPFARITLFQTGIGFQKAWQVGHSAFQDSTWDLVVSSGFAGALRPLPIGTLVAPDRVFVEGSDLSRLPGCPALSPSRCHSAFQNNTLAAARAVQASVRTGELVSVPNVVGTAEEKLRLARRTGALAVDMESAVIGHIAQGHRTPFGVLRAISDGVDEEMPIDFNAFLRPFGWIGGLASVVTTPDSWSGFLRLRRQMAIAAEALTKFFRAFLNQGSGYRPHTAETLTG